MMTGENIIRGRRVISHGLPAALLVLTLNCGAQVSEGGIPASFGMKSLSPVPVVVLPGRAEIENDITSVAVPGIKTLRFAYTFDVDYSMEECGQWDELPDGTRIWRLGMVSVGAFSLNLIFSGMDIPEGAKLFVYSEDRKHLLGAFTSGNKTSGGVFAVMPVPGESIVVEYNLSPECKATGTLVIGKVGHDYVNVFRELSAGDETFGKSGKCNPDINCPDGDNWHLLKRSVCRVIVNGNELCSGVLLNNTALDGKPYLYSVNHCIDNYVAANTLVAVFNYESTWCNGPDGLVSQSVSGSTLMATSTRLDFSLVELSSVPPPSYKPYYAGWKLPETSIAGTVSIHHPQGDVKKIARDDQSPVSATYSDAQGTLDTNAHWKVLRWETGTTEAGSSGAPLIDQDGYVRGVLTGGDAYCGRSVNDYFSKISRAWQDYPLAGQQLKAWLDFSGTGVQSLPGFNPYSAGTLTADFVTGPTRLCQGEAFVVYDYSTGVILQYDWSFGPDASPATATGPGPHGTVFGSAGSKNIRLIVSDGAGLDTIEQTVNISYDTPVTAGFGYTETFPKTVLFTDQSPGALTYYWDFGDYFISSLPNPVHTYSGTSTYQVIHKVSRESCTDVLTMPVQVTSVPGTGDDGIRIYPQPADAFLEVAPGMRFPSGFSVSLFDILGNIRVRQQWHYGAGPYRLVTAHLPGGVYLLKIEGEGFAASRKIVIQHP